MAEHAPSIPPDQAARDRIRHDLQHTLFVEAGAGSGKTTALVGRVLALVASGVGVDQIAAITFTEKAGAELRDRIRDQLESEADQLPDGPERALLGRALDDLDGAALGTLHAFAQRLLAEHPIEVGLPPRVEVLDEVTSGIDFDRRWRRFRDDLLEDPAMTRTILLLLGGGIPVRALRFLAVAFDRNWDLVAERVPAHAPEPPPVGEALAGWLRAADAVCAHRARCLDPADALCQWLDTVAAFVERLRTTDDEVDLLDLLDPKNKALPGFKPGNRGGKDNWPDGKKQVADELRALGELLGPARATVTDAAARHVATAVRRFTLVAARERQEAGRLEFHDLLVLARALVRHPVHGAAVRAHLHQRYRHLLLDEFQDTDPIQIDLAVRIAAAAPEEAASGHAHWPDVAVAPGHLFVVGDPKQSIYRFRRADIATFLAARDRFGPEGGDVVSLTTNFRTARAVVEVVNTTFATLMGLPVDVELPVPSQPDYVALEAVRPDPPVGPPVALLGRAAMAHTTDATTLRAAEADEVARTVATILAEGWSVGADVPGGWRPARLGDITVLVPARTSLPFLEASFEAAGISFRAESSSLVYVSRAVRDLLMVLRAIDDPTNQGSIVAALRTPLLGLGDDDLFRYRVQHGGRWDFTVDPPEGVPADDPVRVALAYLRRCHEERHWCSVAELAERVAHDLRAFEIGFAEGRPRDVWRRLRFVIDQARAWGEATHGGLRQYLQWVALQTAEGARVAEAVLPETDDDAVRIMTIHAAKGLEFPITIVSGLSTKPNSQRAPAEVVFPPGGGVGYRFHGQVATEEFTAFAPIDEQMGFDERIRLLYVAATRARDHLVVSLQRRDRRSPANATTNLTNAELLHLGLSARLDALPDAAAPSTPGEGPALPAIAAPVPPPPPPPHDAWAERRHVGLARATSPGVVAATALTADGGLDADHPDPGLQKRARDLDLPPWLKGRYGTGVGRAVHGVLQHVDLGTGAGLDAAVAAQSQAEGLPDRADDVRTLVRAALASPTVARAAARPHWREVYACTPVSGGRLLEGYIDLLYRDDDGLVVVDYKTSAQADPALLDERVAHYRLQGASYATTVAATTGEAVARVVFVFLTPHGAVERTLPGLDTAVAEVRAQVAAGREVLVDELAG